MMRGVLKVIKKNSDQGVNPYDEKVALAKKWINRNTINNQGIVITSKQRIIYQEVTGYYIPTLLDWGMDEKAICYSKYLCQTQQKSGAWLSGDMTHESVFNSGQVLRGLVRIHSILPETIDSLNKGCQWLTSCIDREGRLVPAKGTIWPANGMNSELIHIYCLPPLLEAAHILNNHELEKQARKVCDYYIRKYLDDILNFKYLSHFYAYVLEALVDLGEARIVQQAMDGVSRIQRLDGAIPAYNNVHWLCSTGMFQLAIVWFKLGEYKKGLRTFEYASSLQNKSGGWYGGYEYTKNSFINNLFYADENITYFPNEEISWAVKYFLDALYLRNNYEKIE